MLTSPPVLVIGAGGHAKVVIELVRAAGAYEIIGLIDQNCLDPAILDVPILGTEEDIPRLRREGITHAFVGIGNNQRRLKTGYYLRQIEFKIINAISPAAIISPSARLGDGIAVMAGAVINAEGRIDDFSIINTHASVDHDCWIGEGAHVCPGYTFAGNVRVGSWRSSVLGLQWSRAPQSVRMRRSVLARAYYETFPMAHQPGVFPQESCGPIISREGMRYPSGRSINLRQVIKK